MRRASLLLTGMLFVVQLARAQAEVTCEGWTVTVDTHKGVISVKYENLGTVLSDVRLNLRPVRALNSALKPLTQWSGERISQNQLSIRTVEPPTRWIIELDPNVLKVSSTSPESVLTANAPAPPDRIVARLLDREGTPVIWRGTEEVNLGFGGSLTENPSFLPRRNPDVMYFALGQVASLNLHSLFDHASDTAIDFPDDTMMRRDQQNPDRLGVTIPVPGNALIRVLPQYYTKALGVGSILKTIAIIQQQMEEQTRYLAAISTNMAKAVRGREPPQEGQ